MVLAAQSAIARPHPSPRFQGGQGGSRPSVFSPRTARSSIPPIPHDRVKPPAHTCSTFRYYAMSSANNRELACFFSVRRASTSQRTEFRQMAIFLKTVGILRKRTLPPANLNSLEQRVSRISPKNPGRVPRGQPTAFGRRSDSRRKKTRLLADHHRSGVGQHTNPKGDL